MSKYAIVQLAGKQFKVSEGDKIVVDRLEQEVNKDFETTDVLLLVEDDKQMVGQPLVKGAKVKFKVLSHDLGDKIRVAKYKAKSKYRKVHGHRQHQTFLEVAGISA